MTLETHMPNRLGSIVAPLAVVGALVGVLALTAAPALAVAPEKPVTGSAESVTPTTEKLEGTLNPHTTASVGGYFAYSNPGGSSCVEGPTAGLEEFEGEKAEQAIGVHTTVGGLEPNQTYEFCLVATDALGEATSGEAVSLTTSPLAPTIEGLSATTVTPFAATLEAQVNPQNEPTECTFEYGPVNAVKLEKEAPCEQGATPGTLEGYGNQTASATVTLSPNTNYYYRLIVKNGTGKAEAQEQLTTLTTKQPAIDGESATGITETEATLEAQVNPNYEDTRAYLQFSTTSTVDANGSLTGATQTPTSPGTDLGEGFGDQPVGPATLTGLTVGETYYYQVVATNATGTGYGTVHSFTTLSPPVVATGEALEVTSAGAELAGMVNPGGLPTTFRFLYVPAAEYEPGAANPYAKGAASLESSAGPDSITHPVFYTAGGLRAGETYDYALVASNALASDVSGPNQTFTTPLPAPPTAAATPASETTPSPAAPPASFPLLTAPSIAELDAREAKEDNSIPNPTITKSPTSAEKLAKALKACRKEKKSRRAKCEKRARGRYRAAIKGKS